MTPLHEQYRPSTFSQVIGQDKALHRFHTVAKRGIGGRAYYLTGKSGVGKTTIGRLIAREIADPCCILESNAQDWTVADVRGLETAMHFYGMGAKTGRAWILNEAHKMKSSVVTRLLTTLEELPDHVAIIFTTTVDGQSLFEDDMDAHPFLSRCVRLPLAQRGFNTAAAAHVHQIATKEGLNGRELTHYVRLANECAGNLRDMLQAVENGEMMP